MTSKLTNYLASMMLVFVFGVATAVAGNYDHCYTDLPIKIKMAEEPVIPSLTVNIKDYGAVGDGITLTTEAIQKAIDDVAKRGGGHVVVPAGIWLITTLELRNNIDLHLERNALLQQTPDKTKYGVVGPKHRFLPCIHGTGLHDISVTGEGAVDGCGKYWRPVKRGKMSDVEWSKYIAMGGTLEENGRLWMPYNLNNVENVTESPAKEEGLRNDLFRPEQCNRVMVRGVSFQNSPRFTVHPCECTNVIVDGVTALSPWNVQNADGIDLSNCRQCLVVNSYVDCGDDGLCLKSGSGADGVKKGPCKDILIQDCRVIHAHGGFVMGSDVAGGMEDIVVRRCMFTNTDIGLRFKSALGRGGTTRNVKIYDIVMTDIANEAIMFNCGYFDNRYSAASSEKQQSTKDVKAAADLYAPDFQDIDINNITCREARTAIKASGIEGLDCVHGITVRNSTFFYRERPTDIDKNTAVITLDNVNITTFAARQAMTPLSEAVNTGNTIATNDNGYLRLKKVLPIKQFRIDANKTTGIDGTIYYTCVMVRSHSNPSLSIEFGFYMNKNHKGRLTVNGRAVDNIGNVLHDGYIYYDLTPYGNDLYIWGVQSNFPANDFLFM